MKLWNTCPGYNPEWGKEPEITPYLVEGGEKRGAVIVFPGGGYEGLAPHEGEPYAKMINEVGVHAFVADYRLTPYKHPMMLYDVLRAVRLVRANAEKWNIDPEKIAVMGSSAGGHASVMAACHYDAPLDYEQDEIDKVSGKPNGCILCYPVVTMGEYTHQGSKDNLLGTNPSEELVDYASCEKNVKADGPKFFLWHTAEDDAVPVENSLNLALALSKKKVPFEAHIFPYGHHGLGLATDRPHVREWAKSLQNWLLLEKY